jgi:hypothetical protein
MNGSDLNKLERKDAEIYYLKSSFESYFALRKVPHYFYDYDDFLLYADQNHPRVRALIKKFGNPFEIDPTVKGNPKVQQPQVNPSQYYNVKLVAKTGKMVNKQIPPKKFQISTGIFPVK